MRYEDASHTGAFQGSQPIANDDLDSLPAGSKTPATGNLISGEGTQTGSAGADVAAGAHVAAIAGKGGEDTSFSGGKLSVSGEHGRLSVDAEGNYIYQANAGVENVRDRFTYTLADNSGASDTGSLIVEIGKTPVVIKANAQQIVPGPDGVVTLPPGVELSDVRVVGRNLVVDLPDGTQLIIIDGAIFVPQLVLNGVEIPSTNLAALLIGQEPQPAAGEAPQSSGGNFDVPVPPLDPGVPLGDLIPPTEYDYTPPEPQDVDDILDREPAIQIQPDGQPASVNAVDSVDEDGLPARDGDLPDEPEGSDEGADGNPSNNSDPDETTAGTIIIDSPDGVDSVTINGVLVTGAIGQVIQGEFGTLTITGFNGNNILYSYTLTDNTSGDNTHDDFSVVLTDDDGDTATATLTIDIIDDVPTARDDTDAVAQGSQSTDGNVMSGVGTTSSPAGIDTVGADDAEVTGVHAGTSGSFTSVPDAGVTIVGQFGDLTLFPDGSYTYTLHAEVGNGGNDVFTYQLTDGDGDIDTATLTIIAPPDLKPTLDAPNVGEAGTVVDEAGLPARPGEPEGSGEEVAPGVNGDASEITTGTINFTPGDTPATITINGVVVTGVIGQSFAGDYGTLTITGFNANGSITYSYVLEDNVDHDTDLTPFEEFDVQITDSDGDTATDTLRIDIVDDAPVANDDTDSVTEDGPLVANGNVVTGVGSDGNPAGDDLVGADDSIVTNVDGLNPGVGSAVATPGGVAIVGQYGTLVIQSDGSYTYTLDNTNPVVQALSDGDTLTEQFEYTLLDNDGDTDTAVLTITINGDNDVPTVDVPVRGEDGTLVDEAGLPPRGSEPPGTGEVADGNPNNESDDSEITSGVINYTPGDGATTITINGVVVTGVIGQSFAGDYGTLVITGFDPVAHTISYTYTLADNVDHDSDATPFETFAVVVSDSDGNPADDASGNLIIDIVNDAPIARDDTDSVVEGGSTNGNVLTGVGGDGNPAGADTPGADDYAPSTVVGVAAGDTEANLTNGSGVGVVVAGTYGTLVLNANGTYTYTATAGSNPPPGATDVFTYTIIDNDGNASNAELIISVIDDRTPTVDVPTQGEAGTSVDEKGLPTRPGEPEGSGEAANPAPNTDNSEITSGVINFTPGDTPATVTINGIVVTGVVGQTFAGDYGTLVITGYNPAGTISYTYTLADNVDHDSDLTPFETFTVTVTDDDGDVASGDLIIDIVNDAPIARDDTDSVVEGGVTNGNVLTGVGGDGNPAGADTPGADNYAPNAVVGVAAGDTEANLTNGSGVGVVVAGTYGTLVLNANGTYTYTATAGSNPPPGATDVFTYTIIDNDGNASNAELVISVIDDLVPDVPENTIVGLDDDALTGGNPGTPALNDDPDSVNTSGSVAAVGGDLPITYALSASGAPAGFSYALQGNGDLWVLQGATHVLTITLDQSGNYTVTQVNPIDHAAGNLENNQSFTVTFRATDVDGDFDDGTLTISVDDDTPIASTAQLSHTVDEDGVVENAAPGTQPGDGIAGGTGDVGGEVVTANGNVSSLFSAGADVPLTYSIAASVASLTAQGLSSGGVPLSYVVGFAAGVYTLTASAGAETVFTFTLNASTGAYTFTLVDQLDHPTLNGLTGDNTENDLTILLGSMIQATDFDGDTVTASANGLNITVDDDSPTLGTIEDGTASNTAADPISSGELNFEVGADAPATVVSITADNTGITSGGFGLVTSFSGNVLTAYQDVDGDGIKDAGETTAVYTLTVNPDAGADGEWVFDLITPLDPTVVDTPIGGSTSFGAGPTGFQVLDDGGGTPLSIVSGYNVTAGFNMATWLASGSTAPSTLASGGVNGSTSGWGIDNNNFDAGEFFNWDFGPQAPDDPDGPGAFVPPANPNMPNISFATFEFIGYSAGDEMYYVVHYTDGTFDSGQVPTANVDAGLWTFNADPGKFIADIEMYTPDAAPGKVDLVSVGVTSSDLDETIDFNVTLSDSDGDQVSGGFSVNVADGNSPSQALLVNSSSSDMQLQKVAANSNTLTLAAAVAAAGFVETQAAAAPAHDGGRGRHEASDVPSGGGKHVAANVSADDTGYSVQSNEAPAAANDSAPVDSSSHSSAPAESNHSLDDGSAKAEAQSSEVPTANDQGPASSSVEASPAALAVGMPSVEALQAAGVAGNAQQGGSVEQIVADALGQGNASATVDALLNALPGGNGAVGALANLASPAANSVPGGDMSVHGGFAASHDMMFNVHAAMQHHDAVQPVANG